MVWGDFDREEKRNALFSGRNGWNNGFLYLWRIREMDGWCLISGLICYGRVVVRDRQLEEGAEVRTLNRLGGWGIFGKRGGCE